MRRPLRVVELTTAVFTARNGLEFHVAMHNMDGLGIRRLLEGYQGEIGRELSGRFRFDGCQWHRSNVEPAGRAAAASGSSAEA